MLDPRMVSTTGIYHVVTHDGRFPFWVEARTYNKAPVFGQEVRIRGFDSVELATKAMRSLTRKALEADPSLKADFLVDRDGVPIEEVLKAATTVNRYRGGRPKSVKPPVEIEDFERWEDKLGAPKQRRKRRKPGPVPKKKDPRKAHPFISTRFTMEPDLSNPIAQVWRCTANYAKARGRAAGRGLNHLGDAPHLSGSYAISLLIDGELYHPVTQDGFPEIYPDWLSAQRDAEHFWEIAEEPKQPYDSLVYYSNGVIEVHLAHKVSRELPFTLFDARYNVWLKNTRAATQFARLDNAIRAADDYRDETAIPASARLAMALHETEEDRMERLLREEAEDARFARIEAERTRLYEQEMAELREIASRRREERKKRGWRVMTKEEVAAMKAKMVYTTKPTKEQRLQAYRKKYAPRAAVNQRGEPPSRAHEEQDIDDVDNEEDVDMD